MTGTLSLDKGHLRAFIERIELLESEKQTIADDIKQVYAEAKGNGYDAKIMRKVVSLRRQDRDKRRDEEELLDLYMESLGDLRDTPLRQAAVSSFSIVWD